MKVLCINTNGLLNDGITNSILGYYSNMDKSDMTIDLLQTSNVVERMRERIEQEGLRIISVKLRKNIFQYIFAVAKLVRKEKYDIVHVHGSSALLAIDLLAAWMGGCRVRIAHSRNTQCSHAMLDKLLRPLFYCLCTTHFACGEDAGKWLFGRRKFEIIHNGKDIIRFQYNENKRSEIREKYGWEDKYVIGHVGNFNYQKNHTFLVDVFNEVCKEIPNAILVLMGTGKEEYVHNVKEKIYNLKITDKVIFMGSVNNVSELLQAMDIMLLPSRFEGLPNVVLEWQISGVKALISDQITKECRVTNLVEYLPIDQGTIPWCSAIVKDTTNNRNRLHESDVACALLREKGYDICEGAKRLKKIYKELIEKMGD